MNYTFELNNAVYDDIKVAKPAEFKKFCEICSALFAGQDTAKYGTAVDTAVKHLKELGANTVAGDFRARAEINEIMKFMVEPKLIEAMKLFTFLGNYHRIPYNVQPRVKGYKYENINARKQASGGDVAFAKENWFEYSVETTTISSGMAIDYRELASGNFDGTIAEETSQVQIDMNNKAVAYVLEIIATALKNNSLYVKFYDEYSTAPTVTEIEAMGAKIRKFGKVSIAGDYSVISTISDFNGYKSVGATPTLLPFYNATQLDEIRRTGLCGFYKDYALVEIPNPYNVTKPNAALTAFDTYFATDKLWFIPQGVTSPVNVFARGGITTLSGNDIETGTVKTRFDMEIGADVAKGFEYKIGLMAAEA